MILKNDYDKFRPTQTNRLIVNDNYDYFQPNQTNRLIVNNALKQIQSNKTDQVIVTIIMFLQSIRRSWVAIILISCNPLRQTSDNNYEFQSTQTKLCDNNYDQSQSTQTKLCDNNYDNVQSTERKLCAPFSPLKAVSQFQSTQTKWCDTDSPGRQDNLRLQPDCDALTTKKEEKERMRMVAENCLWSVIESIKIGPRQGKWLFSILRTICVA